MRTGIRAAAFGGMGLLAASVAACGSSGGSPSGGASSAPAHSSAAIHAVQDAYTSTVSAKTAAFRIVEKVQAKSSSGSSQNVTITGSGNADFPSRAFMLRLNAPSGGSIDVLLRGGIEYLRVPKAQRSQIPGHKPWASLNLNKIAKAKLGASFSQLASAGNDNPAQALSSLASVSDNVTKTGTAAIDGVSTTAYRAEVNLNKVAAKLAAKAGQHAAKAIKQEEQALGTSTLPETVWVDAHHMVRQIRYQVPIPAASGGTANGSGTATMTMTFSGFGSPVHLTPPPASQTADITNIALRQVK